MASSSSSTTQANVILTKLRLDSGLDEYDSWREQVVRVLGNQNLLGFIDGKIPPPQKGMINSEYHDKWTIADRVIKDYIFSVLSAEVEQIVDNFDTARDVWLQLENMFTASSGSATLSPAAHQGPATRDVSQSQGSVSGSATPTQPAADEGTNWNNYIPLYKAALRGDWDTAIAILQQDPGAAATGVTFTSETALHIAVGAGPKAISFVEKLVDTMSDDMIALKDSSGATALLVAAATGNTAASKTLVTRVPSLLYEADYVGSFAVHAAALSAKRETLEFFISQTKENMFHMKSNPLDGESGVLLLVALIHAKFFDIALNLVEENPQLAGIRLSTRQSALLSTALRPSAFYSGTQFNIWQRLIYSSIELETASEKPPATSKTGDIEAPACSTLVFGDIRRWHQVIRNFHKNSCKFIKKRVPLIKDIHEKKMMHQQALQLVKCLCKNMETLSHKEASPIYVDGLLTASRMGIHEVVEVIVETFPSAFYSRDGTRNFMFHLAVKNRCEKVYNLIYQMSDHKHRYSGLADNSGNTLLHLAARLAPPHKLNLISGAALQMQREIQWYKEVETFVHPYIREQENHAGKTPKMVFTEEHKSLKLEGEKWMKDTANSCTIAAALIATVVFAAAITVPGGNADTGYPLFSKSSAFIVFAAFDAVSLFTSTTSLLMFLSILTSRYAEEDFLYALPKRLCVGLLTLFVSILSMMAAFSATLYLVFGQKNAWVVIPAAALACLPVTSFVLLQFPLLVDVISSTYGPGIFGKQSDRPFY